MAPSLELPLHERHCRPAVRQMPGGLAKRSVVAALHQGEPACRVVADRGDLLLSPGCGRDPRFHTNRIARSSSDPSLQGSPAVADHQIPARRSEGTAPLPIVLTTHDERRFDGNELTLAVIILPDS
jgi:hypothetical protein